MRRKGLIGWIAACFAAGVFAALFLVIFLYSFKYHVTMMMVDYYLWGKEYDIPLALFSTDIGGNSSIVAMNKIYYEDISEKYNGLRREIQDSIDFWFPNITKSDYTREFNLTFGDESFRKEKVKCLCEKEEDEDKGKCSVGCGPNAGKECGEDPECKPTENVINVNYHGSYLLPVVFNGTHRITKLEWASSVIWWIES